MTWIGFRTSLRLFALLRASSSSDTCEGRTLMDSWSDKDLNFIVLRFRGIYTAKCHSEMDDYRKKDENTMHIHIFFPCDFLTSIIWNRPISWWSSFRFEVEEPPSRKQSNGESRPSVAWHAGNLMVDFIFTPPDISGTQGWSQTPRSIAAGWSLLECWIAFSIFCILADRGWSDILKEGSRSPVVDYQHTSSLAARWTSHSIHRCAFFCATCTGHKCAGLRVKRCESARWLQKVGTQFFFLPRWMEGHHCHAMCWGFPVSFEFRPFSSAF